MSLKLSSTLAESATPLRTPAAHAAGAVRSLWGDYMVILGAHAALACLSLAGLVLSARLLGPQAYVAVVLCVTVIQLCFIVGTKWSFPALIRFGREALVREGHAGRAVWAWAPLFLGSLAVCAAGLLGGARLIVHIVGPQSPPTSLYVLVFLFTAVGTAGQQLLQMQGKMKVAAGIPVLGKLLFVALLLALSLRSAGQATPLQVVRCLAWAAAAEALLALGCVGREVLRPWGFEGKYARTIARYSFFLWPGFLAAYLSEWVDLYFLRFFGGQGEIGAYQIAYQVFLFLTVGLTGIYTLVFPLLTGWMAEGRENRVRRYALRLTPQICVLWGVMILALGVVQAPCLLWLFGPEFAASTRLFSVLLVSSAIQPIFFLYGPLLLTHDSPDQNTVVVVTMAAVNVVGDLALVPRYGAFGAAGATALSFAVRAWLCLAWGHRRLGIDRQATLVPAGLIIVSLLALIGQPWGVRLAIFAGATGLLVGWVRLRGLFTEHDLSMVEQIQCPAWIGAGLRRVYEFLSPRRHVVATDEA